MLSSPGKLLLPDLESVEADVVLDVLERPPEAGNGLGQDGKLGRKFVDLKQVFATRIVPCTKLDFCQLK
jgi:hypothetical protein